MGELLVPLLSRDTMYFKRSGLEASLHPPYLLVMDQLVFLVRPVYHAFSHVPNDNTLVHMLSTKLHTKCYIRSAGPCAAEGQGAYERQHVQQRE